MPDDAKPSLTVSVFGVTIPISRWSISGFSVLALAAVALLLYRQAVPTDLVTLRQANAQLAFEVREYGQHLGDQPERVFSDPDGTLLVQIYMDHCVTIQRKSAATGVQTRLIPDPARVALQPTIGQRPTAWLPVVEAAGQCLNPHPGTFTTGYGERRGCVVQVWRRWQDNCEHWQNLDACNGTWETNGDGSPAIHWTRCVH